MVEEASGDGWPNPSEPGVPAEMLHGGFHWMRWPSTGAVTVGQWDPDVWGWVLSYLGGISAPEALAHLDYIGSAKTP